jgi:hypothetical protein
MKSVYIAKNIQNLNELKLNSKDVIYSLDSQTSEQLSNTSLKHKDIKEILSFQENTVIESEVLKIAVEWYKQKEIKDHLIINKINLGFLVELELYSFLLEVIRNIRIIEKIILYEKPDKIISLGNVNYLEFIAKKYDLPYEISKQEKKFSEFGMDKIHVRYDLFNHPVGITLSYQKYISLREKLEKLTKFIVRIIQKNSKINENFLLLEFNPVIFTELLKSAKKLNYKLNLLNLRRPVIWNIKSFKIIKNSNADIIIASDYVKNKEIINPQIKKFNSNLKNMFEKEIILTNIFSINHETYWPIIKNHIESFLKSRGIQAIKEYHMANNLFNMNNFKAVLGLNDNLQIEKTILAVAKQKGISTLILQHGIFNNDFLKDSPYIRINAILPLVAEYFLVWGKIVQKYALDQGWKPEFISVIGSPKFDYLFKKLKSKKTNKKILLATSSGQFLDYESFRRYRESIKKTCEILQNLKNYELQVKVHPYEQEFSMIQEVVKEVNPAIPIIINGDLDEMIESSDIIITFNLSTVLLHASIAEKPTIAVWIEHHYKPDKVISRYDSIVFTQYENLEVELKKILEDSVYCEQLIKNQKKLIDDYFANQGNASEELLKFMSKL